MGIPTYFNYIIKKYPQIISDIDSQMPTVDTFYMDCNSIIYDVHNKLPQDITLTLNMYENMLINKVIEKINYYIDIVKPISFTMVAFDGIAPKAKMKQQRVRRFKTSVNTINTSLFTTLAITPGTTFMNTLTLQIKEYYVNNTQVIVSSSDEMGEGEHKIFEHIRKNKTKALNTIFVYGLDADLFMLSLTNLTYASNIYLFRENMNMNNPMYLNIQMLHDKILEETQIGHIYDYIFICFLLGNDFMPHFPALNIRTTGLQTLLNNYTTSLITNTGCIIWSSVKDYVLRLASAENVLLQNEENGRSKLEYYVRKQVKESGIHKEKTKDFVELNTPILNREIERYINFYKPYYKYRYYYSLFTKNESNITSLCNMEQVISQICNNYLEGLEWTFRYYVFGCVDNTWTYKYNYPPLLQDLANYTDYVDHFIPNNNNNKTDDLHQLLYVLPPQYYYLIPNRMDKLTNEISNEKPIELQYAYCRYLWEAHIEE